MDRRNAASTRLTLDLNERNMGNTVNITLQDGYDHVHAERRNMVSNRLRNDGT